MTKFKKKKRTRKNNKVSKSFKKNKKNRIDTKRKTKRNKKIKRRKKITKKNKMKGGMMGIISANPMARQSPGTTLFPLIGGSPETGRAPAPLGEMSKFEISKKSDYVGRWDKRYAEIRGGDLLFYKDLDSPSPTSIKDFASATIVNKGNTDSGEIQLDITGKRIVDGKDWVVSIEMSSSDFSAFQEVHDTLKVLKVLPEVLPLYEKIVELIETIKDFLNGYHRAGSAGFEIDKIHSFKKGSAALIVVFTNIHGVKKILKIKLSEESEGQQIREYETQEKVQLLGEEKGVDITVPIDLNSFICLWDTRSAATASSPGETSPANDGYRIFEYLYQLENLCLQCRPYFATLEKILPQIGGNIEYAKLDSMPGMWYITINGERVSMLNHVDPRYPTYLSVVMMDYFDGIDLGDFSKGAYGHIMRMKHGLSDPELIKLIQKDPDMVNNAGIPIPEHLAQKLLDESREDQYKEEWARKLYDVLEDTRNKIKIIHEAGIYHCDMNRSNVMVDLQTFTVRIIDFEFAHTYETEGTEFQAVWDETEKCEGASDLSLQQPRMLTQALIEKVCGEEAEKGGGKWDPLTDNCDCPAWLLETNAEPGPDLGGPPFTGPPSQQRSAEQDSRGPAIEHESTPGDR